jgi:pimeloyl-ACP methyl ester carboxylesterase
MWRRQFDALSDVRRCIAVDLLAHGDTEIAFDQNVSVTTNAKMLKEVLDALQIDQVDLIGNDSGGGICQIFAALNPDRVRTLTLTNCDTHDNWPPEAFKPFVEMVAAGGLPKTLNAMLGDKSIYRSPGALGPAYEDPSIERDEDIEIYLRPHVRSEQRTRDLERFVGAFDNKHTLAIDDRLAKLTAPTLIVWATDDVYFPIRWAHWLAKTIPGAKAPVELEGARLFFPLERADAFNDLLRGDWTA